MDWIDSRSNCQTLPQVRRNTQRTRPEDQERPRINKHTPGWEDNLVNKNETDAEAEFTCPTTKEHNIFVQIYNVEEDKALLKTQSVH